MKCGYQWQAQDMLVGTGCCYIPSRSHLGPPCCVFKSAPCIQNVYFLLPRMRLYHSVHRPWHGHPPAQGPGHSAHSTLFSSWEMIHPVSIKAAHSGTGAPREDNPLGWGGNLVKLFTLLLSPLRLRLSFPAPPQLAAVLLPLCSWALLVSTAAVTSCQISHRAVTALAAPLCTNTLHSWFFSLFTGHVSFPGSSLSAQSPDAPGNHACIRSTAGNALFEVYTETHGLRCISWQLGLPATFGDHPFYCRSSSGWLHIYLEYAYDKREVICSRLWVIPKPFPSQFHTSNVCTWITFTTTPHCPLIP